MREVPVFVVLLSRKISKLRFVTSKTDGKIGERLFVKYKAHKKGIVYGGENMKTTREKPRERIKEVREKGSIFAKKRVEIAFDMLKMIEDSIRGDPTILLSLIFRRIQAQNWRCHAENQSKRTEENFWKGHFRSTLGLLKSAF